MLLKIVNSIYLCIIKTRHGLVTENRLTESDDLKYQKHFLQFSVFGIQVLQERIPFKYAVYHTYLNIWKLNFYNILR